eukprot:g8449.t1
MGRQRVDSAAAEKACEAVRSGLMSQKAAAAAFGVGRTSLQRRLSGVCAMDARPGPRTVMTAAEEDAVEDLLLYAGRNYIPLSTADLRERVRQLCNDGRQIPWNRDKGPGKDWLRGFLGRHERISKRLARIYESNRVTTPEDERLHKFYDFWGEFLAEHKPQPDHIWNTDESGGTIQGTQGQRVLAERGQPVVPQMRSTSRENCTIVTTINATGAVLAPTIIFKGQRLNADWVADKNGPPGATYTCTESSFMCGDVFIKYIKDFHKQLCLRNLLDGKPHVLVLDGHASHVSLDVVDLARSLDIHLVQLPSHMSHITQPLDVAGFGCFKKELTKAIQAFPATHGGALPRKRDMAAVIEQAWSTSFTPEINRAFRWGGPMAGGQGASTRSAAAAEEEGEELMGDRAIRKLQGEGHSITGLRVSTVFLSDFLPSKCSKKPPTRANLGIPEGGLLTADGWVEEMRKKEREAEAAEAEKDMY